MANKCILKSNILLNNVRRTFSSTSTKYAYNYESAYNKSINNPEEFWNEVAQGIEWFKPYKKTMDNSYPPFTKWFVGGELNTCHNAVDRHVSAGLGDKPAVIYDSPITNQRNKISYSELKTHVSKLAGALSRLGVSKGDSVIIYMPMIPQTIIAMLAVSRLGAVHSVVFGGFSAEELAKRINHCKAKVVLASSCGVEPSRIVKYKPVLDNAISIASHKPKHCIIYQRHNIESADLIPDRDFSWDEIIDKSQPHDCVPVESSHPAYVLYTSGTTGMPKGIVRPTGGHAVVLPWSMKCIYGLEQSDNWWSMSDFGWVVGHSYICYAPLLNGNSTIVYEGKPVGTPDETQTFRVISENNVKAMFMAPTALRGIAKVDPNGECGKSYDISSLKYIFIAGEPLDHETQEWTEKTFNVPALNHWWQTETGFSISTTCVGLGMRLNAPKTTVGKAFLGYNLRVIKADGSPAKTRELGRIISKLPLPPGTFSTLLGSDDRFKETYFEKFPGYYDSMDAGYVDEEGYVFVESREDDVINVAGHRLSTLAIEEAILSHPDIVDVASVGVPDPVKGEVPLALFVKLDSSDKSEEILQKEIVQVVREKIGPVAAFKLCGLVKALPKTRSGKIPRKSIADLAKDKEFMIPPTIEDPSVYGDIINSLQRIGYAKKVQKSNLA